MSLDEVKLLTRDPIALFDVDEVMRRWDAVLPSSIFHHGRRCCALAREWIFSTDHAQLNGESSLTGPRWLRHRFTWGPSPWPMSWCEIVKRKVLDCGAFAALSHEIFSTRGLKSWRAQVIQEFTDEATGQWLSKWSAEDIPVNWITPGLIYHEVCAVETSAGRLKLWDPSAGWWIETRRTKGYGAVRALRVFVEATDSAADQLIFDHHTLNANQWQELTALPPTNSAVVHERLPLPTAIETETFTDSMILDQ